MDAAAAAMVKPHASGSTDADTDDDDSQGHDVIAVVAPLGDAVHNTPRSHLASAAGRDAQGPCTDPHAPATEARDTHAASATAEASRGAALSLLRLVEVSGGAEVVSPAKKRWQKLKASTLFLMA